MATCNDCGKPFNGVDDVCLCFRGGAAPAYGCPPWQDESAKLFSIFITSTGDNIVPIIKVIREVTGVGLKEAVDLAKGKVAIKEYICKEEAKDIQYRLEKVGAVVKVSS